MQKKAVLHKDKLCVLEYYNHLKIINKYDFFVLEKIFY